MSANTARLGEASLRTLRALAATTEPGEWEDRLWVPAAGPRMYPRSNRRRVIAALIQRGLIEQGVEDGWCIYRLTLDAWAYALKRGWITRA